MVISASRASVATECVYGPDAPKPWDDVDELELATLSWVHWFNHEQRLHGHCGDIPPIEYEAAHYVAQQPSPLGVGTNNPSLHQTQGDSWSVHGVIWSRVRESNP